MRVDGKATKRRKTNAGQALNLQAKKQATKLKDAPVEEKEREAVCLSEPGGALSQADTREDEEDKEAFWSLIKLFIRCHESENQEVMQGNADWSSQQGKPSKAKKKLAEK